MQPNSRVWAPAGATSERAIAEVAAAHALIEAAAERTRRDETASTATDERDAAIEDSVFDDVASVERALRSASDQQALEARVTAHSVRREKEREILFDLELRTLPEEPIDLQSAERESQAARRRWMTAVDEASRATVLSGLPAA